VVEAERAHLLRVRVKVRVKGVKVRVKA